MFLLLQRWNPVDGFSERLLPSDRWQWSDVTGLKNQPLDSFLLPSANWEWEADWYADENFGGEPTEKGVCSCYFPLSPLPPSFLSCLLHCFLLPHSFLSLYSLSLFPSPFLSFPILLPLSLKRLPSLSTRLSALSSGPCMTLYLHDERVCVCRAGPTP